MDYSDPVVMELMIVRVKLLLEKPFFGNMATRLTLVEAPWCNTAATDGIHFFYNREFIKNLTRPQKLFLMAHEVLHNVLEHIGRRGSRDKDIANQAMDYVINHILTAERMGTMPPGGCYDEKYTGEMYWEEVYELLKKNSVTLTVGFDEHLDASGDGDGDGEASGSGKGGSFNVTVQGKDGPPKLSEADIQAIRNKVRADAIQTMQQCGAGSVPLGVRRMLNALISPKLDWRDLLDTFTRSALKSDYTFQRLSRRSWFGEAILPAMSHMDRVELSIRCDGSGSTTQEMVTEFLSETKGITDSFPDYRIDLATFDTEIYNQVEITPDNSTDLETYEFKGGGGTMFEAIYEDLKRNEKVPMRLVIFTDGYPNSGWGDPDYCDTLFVIHGNPHIVAPFGITAHYEAQTKTSR